ncbi:MAG: tyrosine recombinase [Kiritimatiellae bacterium]|nr:tyrosine recombinase [Kiritimatiellia bacterium]
MNAAFSEAADSFAAELALERGLAPLSQESYARETRQFAEWAEDRGFAGPGAVGRAEARAYLGHLFKTARKSTTRAHAFVVLREFYAHLVARGRLKANPFEGLDAPKKSQSLPKTLTEAETRALLESVSGEDPRDVRDRALLELLYGCGLRVSELCALPLEAFAVDPELVRVTGKGSKDRMVPIGAQTAKTVNRYLEDARGSFLKDPGERHVFLTRLGRPFTRAGIFKILKERAVAAGLDPEKVSPHVLRHCFATHMIEHGADVRLIQEMLGHASVATTQVYVHVDRRRLKGLHEKLHPRG